MARMTTKERKRQIIDQAMQIIHDQGYPALSIRELAKKVGISEPAIYRHFTNKEEILNGILDRMLIFGNMLNEKLDEFDTAKERIMQLIMLQLRFLENHPELTAVLFYDEIFDPQPSLGEKLQLFRNSRFLILESLINQAKSEGTVVNVRTQDLIVVILGIISMIILEWRRRKFTFSLDDRGRGMIDSLERLIFVDSIVK
ncbi:MAG: TetR/AcrR family transcriptional regulator [Calditrichaceae bacterium]